MNIKPMQKVIKKIILLIALIISPYIGNAQFGNGPCTILDTVLIDGFCWDPVSSTGTITIVPVDQITYNYSIF